VISLANPYRGGGLTNSNHAHKADLNHQRQEVRRISIL
jgi:hypothetical protein